LRKRKNRIILETINAIMHDQNISMISWAEACMTQYMLKTRVYTRIEAFTRVNPEIETLQVIWVPGVFSCTQREEVQNRSFRKKGYNESSKTFQIDIPRQRQIETSINVVLEEEIVFQRSKKSQMDINSKTIPSPPSSV
jgi:hypothetical protein